MKNWKERIVYFVQGRTGVDELGRTTAVLSIVCSLLGTVLGSQILGTIGTVFAFYFILRFFSKRSYVRIDENTRYLSWCNLQKMRFQQRKEYRIYPCKGCRKNIRVPKGKGKIEITCPKCGRKMIRRS